MKTLSLICACVLVCAAISCTPMDMPIRRDDFSYPGGTTDPKPIVLLSNTPDYTDNPESLLTASIEGTDVPVELGN